LTEVDPITGITFKATLKFDPEPMASTAVIQAAWKMGFDAAKAEQTEPIVRAIESGESFAVLEKLAADFRKGLK
jgi:hypothetical protein